MQKDYEFFMKLALNEAKNAYNIDEVPVGCLITKGEQIIATAFNQRNSKKNALCHAEIIAIGKACEKIGDWRLEGCTMFVTIEPCAMCSGAILQARLSTVVFGAKNKKAGCCGSILNILQNQDFNFQASVVSGVLQEEASLLMQQFFKKLRKS